MYSIQKQVLHRFLNRLRIFNMYKIKQMNNFIACKQKIEGSGFFQENQMQKKSFGNEAQKYGQLSIND